MAKWSLIKKDNPETYKGARGTLNPVILRVLANRGIIGDAAVDEFLDCDPSGCHPPEMMNGMETATSLILSAIREKKKILAVGDYDADGIIGTYILLTGLKRLGADVLYRIPHRVSDGYGINDAIIEEAVQGGFGMLITCDNGISAFEQVKAAVDAGITVILTDHHDIPDLLPPAHAILNPKQADCGYPNKQICGAGVAWKLIAALYEKEGIEASAAADFMEFAAIATVCDMVDLTGENRIIVMNGMRMITHTENPGLRALMRASGLEGQEMTAYMLGYVIGPAMNATGRLDHAKLALELLVCVSEQEAYELAKVLREMNAERQRLTEKGYADASADILEKGYEKDRVIVEYLPGIHESISGIIAGRLKEKYGRPVFVLTDARDGVKGSGRSIEGYDMNGHLKECADLLDRYGGHPMAAGFTIQPGFIDALRSRINAGCGLTPEDFESALNIDLVLQPDRVNERLASDLAQLEPYGKGNRQPVFVMKDIRIESARVIGKQANTLKFRIDAGNECDYEGIYFGKDRNELKRLADGSIRAHIAFQVSMNEFRGARTLQLTVQDFKSAEDVAK